MIWLAWIVGLGALVAVYAGVTTTDEVTDAGVMVGKAFVLDQHVRPYTSVRKIERRTWLIAPNGNLVRRAHYVVTFDDGRQWNTHRVLWDTDDVSRVVAVMRYVAARSGRPIQAQAPPLASRVSSASP